MRPWGLFSRHCEAICYAQATRRTFARRHASSRSRVEAARAEHAENVEWAKRPEARGVLEQPPFDGEEGKEEGRAAGAAALDSLDTHLQVRLLCVV